MTDTTADQLRRYSRVAGADPDNTVLYAVRMTVEIDIKAGRYDVMKSKVERPSGLGEPIDLHAPVDMPVMMTMISASSTTPQVGISFQQRRQDDPGPLSSMFYSSWRAGARLMELETYRTGDPLDGAAMVVNLVSAMKMEVYPRLTSLPDDEAISEADRIHEMLVAGVPVQWII